MRTQERFEIIQDASDLIKEIAEDYIDDLSGRCIIDLADVIDNAIMGSMSVMDLRTRIRRVRVNMIRAWRN